MSTAKLWAHSNPQAWPLWWDPACHNWSYLDISGKKTQTALKIEIRCTCDCPVVLWDGHLVAQYDKLPQGDAADAPVNLFLVCAINSLASWLITWKWFEWMGDLECADLHSSIFPASSAVATCEVFWKFMCKTSSCCAETSCGTWWSIRINMCVLHGVALVWTVEFWGVQTVQSRAASHSFPASMAEGEAGRKDQQHPTQSQPIPWMVWSQAPKKRTFKKYSYRRRLRNLSGEIWGFR